MGTTKIITKQMTPDDKHLLFWDMAVFIIIAIIGGGLSYGIFCAWKKRAVFWGGKYGAAAYLRDTQPFKYLVVMLVYTLLVIIIIFVLCLIGKEVLGLLH